MERRIQELRKKMVEQKIDAILVQQAANRRYMSLFTGSSASLYISHQQQVLLTDFRYVEQATKQSPNYKIIDHTKKGLYVTLNELIMEDQAKSLGFEADAITYHQYEEYNKHVKIEEMIPIQNVIETLRMVKSEDEIKSIQQAAKIADQAFTHILSVLKAGVTEKDMALELEFFMKKQGAQNLSFDTIVASGVRSSLPHGVPTHKIIEEGDFVTFDFGCIYDGYCSDMTRTVVIGKASDKQKEIYNTVLAAQEQGLASIRPEITGKEVDQVARDLITAAGYGAYFGHGLGHGVGLEIHEEPRLSLTGEKVLKTGMVVTVEPGIYIPDFGGVRIEDLVVVTEDGIENLTSSPKSLIEL
ncbi:MAG: aminopeptidase P family protein [Epulopiscium sp.]|mgnify:CR=1 FL=1|nr:aminopeptidase P family protein [Candidatus Epulonipiscium sp.]